MSRDDPGPDPDRGGLASRLTRGQWAVVLGLGLVASLTLFGPGQWVMTESGIPFPWSLFALGGVELACALGIGWVIYSSRDRNR